MNYESIQFLRNRLVQTGKIKNDPTIVKQKTILEEPPKTNFRQVDLIFQIQNQQLAKSYKEAGKSAPISQKSEIPQEKQFEEKSVLPDMNVEHPLIGKESALNEEETPEAKKVIRKKQKKLMEDAKKPKFESKGEAEAPKEPEGKKEDPADAVLDTVLSSNEIDLLSKSEEKRNAARAYIDQSLQAVSIEHDNLEKKYMTDNKYSAASDEVQQFRSDVRQKAYNDMENLSKIKEFAKPGNAKGFLSAIITDDPEIDEYAGEKYTNLSQRAKEAYRDSIRLAYDKQVIENMKAHLAAKK